MMDEVNQPPEGSSNINVNELVEQEWMCIECGKRCSSYVSYSLDRLRYILYYISCLISVESCAA